MDKDIKPLTKEERWVCEILFGGVPTDTKWVRECDKFIKEMEEFNKGKWDDLYQRTKHL